MRLRDAVGVDWVAVVVDGQESPRIRIMRKSEGERCVLVNFILGAVQVPRTELMMGVGVQCSGSTQGVFRGSHLRGMKLFRSFEGVVSVLDLRGELGLLFALDTEHPK